MTRALAITNAQPVEDVIGNLHDALAILQVAHKPDRAEIKTGSTTAFAAWCERRFGAAARSEPNKPCQPSLMGVPVVVSSLLPPNRAVLLVNNEVRAIIDLDADGDGST